MANRGTSVARSTSKSESHFVEIDNDSQADSKLSRRKYTKMAGLRNAFQSGIAARLKSSKKKANTRTSRVHGIALANNEGIYSFNFLLALRLYGKEK